MKKKLSLIFLHYLRILAKIQLLKVSFLLKIQGKKLTLIGITGSAGKTSTLLAAESMIKSTFSVKTNYGANSESGIPLNILGIKPKDFSPLDWLLISLLAPLKIFINWQVFQVYLIEMGIDEPTEPKNMSYLLKIVKPTIGVFLNVNPVHSAQFDPIINSSFHGKNRLHQILLAIGREKAKLINQLSPKEIAILNFDDPIVVAATQNSISSKITFGHSTNTTIKIIPKKYKTGFFTKYSINGKNYDLNLPTTVLPQIYETSFAAALAIALSLNISPDVALNNLQSNFHLPPGRSTVLKGINGLLIIDSTYNSSPKSAENLVSLLSQFPSPKIAVLGDMRELGQQSIKAHQNLLKHAQKTADIVIGVGIETQKYFTKVPTFQFWWQASDFLKNNILTDKKFHQATILIKGSQNTIYLEELVKSILADPSDSSQLCRQSTYWLKVKSKFFAANS